MCLEVEFIEVVLARVFVRATEKVEIVTPDQHTVSCPSAVRFVRAFYNLPFPVLVWLDLRCISRHCHRIVIRRLRRLQIHSVRVVLSVTVESSQDIHMSVVDNGFVEGPRGWRFTSCHHFRPSALHHVELEEVRKAVLRLIHSAERKPSISPRLIKPNPWATSISARTSTESFVSSNVRSLRYILRWTRC